MDCCPEVAVTFPVSYLGEGLFFTDTSGRDWYLEPDDMLNDLSRASHFDGEEKEGM